MKILGKSKNKVDAFKQRKGIFERLSKIQDEMQNLDDEVTKLERMKI